ncbi:hypothetical protein Tco_1025754 [Tanacetum coccineum]
MEMTLAEAEYVAAAGCCAHVLWIKSQLDDYDVLYDKVPPFCDNTSAIAISNNLVLHSRTKYIDIKYHFIRDHILKAEVVEETKTISFLLSWRDKPMSFTQDVSISAIGLPIYKDAVPQPPKETIRDGMATLGLFDKDKPTLSSTILGSHDQMNLNQQKIAYCLIWGLEIDIGLLSEGPKQSLMPPFREVNADDTADKSLSRASVQPVTQPKAPTDMKRKKKRTPPSSKPKSLYKVRVILSKKQVTETQHAKVTVATADATKSLVLDQNVEEEVKDTGFVAMEEVTFEHIINEVDSKTQSAQENVESPYDIESEIKIIKSYQAATIYVSLFIYQSSSYGQDDQDVINITPKDAEE